MDGRSYTLLLHHGLGPNMSQWQVHLYTQAIREIVGVVPKADVGGNSLVKFERP